MRSFGSSFGIAAPVKRTASLAGALLVGGLVAGPLTPVWAQMASNPGQTPAQPAATPAPAAMPAPSSSTTARHGGSAMNHAVHRAETVDQRITTLHARLQITPAEENSWKAVALAMRENAAAMEKLATTNPGGQTMTAVEDLQTYQQFAQQRVDGLKTLTAAFSSLYDSMPAQQKKVADRVFQQVRGSTAQSG